MAKKPRPGTEPIYDEAMPEGVNVRFPKEMLEKIDRLRHRRIDKPNRSVMIRELVASALTSV